MSPLKSTEGRFTTRSGVNILTPSGEVIGRMTTGGAASYYLKDHLGSVRAVVNASGAVLETRDYYPYGLEMPGRSYLSGTKAKENFTGHELDVESGLIYAGARYYMPNIGRWTSVDPLASAYPGWSPYNYVLNNPLRYTDPDGKEVVPVGNRAEVALINRYLARLQTSETGAALYNMLHSRSEVIRIQIGSVGDEQVLGNTNVKGRKSEGLRITITLDVDDVAAQDVATQEGTMAHEMQHAADALIITEQYAQEVHSTEELPRDKRREAPHEQRAERTREIVQEEIRKATPQIMLPLRSLDQNVGPE